MKTMAAVLVLLALAFPSLSEATEKPVPSGQRNDPKKKVPAQRFLPDLDAASLNQNASDLTDRTPTATDSTELPAASAGTTNPKPQDQLDNLERPAGNVVGNPDGSTEVPETETERREREDERIFNHFAASARNFILKAKAQGLSEDEFKKLQAVTDDMINDLPAGSPIREGLQRFTNKFKPSPKPVPAVKPKPGEEKPAGPGDEGKPGNSVQVVRDLFWGAHKGISIGDMRNNPDDPRGYANHGGDLVAEGKYKEAAPILEKAVRLGSRDSKTYSDYGTAAYHLGDYKLASKAAAQALKLDGSNEAAFALARLSDGRASSINLPSALTGQGGDPFAASATQGSAGAQPVVAPQAGQADIRPEPARTPEQRRSLDFSKAAAGALAVRDYARAVVEASKAIELNERNAQAWNYRGIGQSKLGRFQDAVRDASFALGVVPGNTAALHTRAWALNKLGKYQEGLADADSVLSREPDNSFALQNKAFSLAGLGDREGMRAALKRSADIDPKFKERYDRAVQVPENADVMFLFDQDSGPSLAPVRPASGGKRRAGAVAAAVVSGGLLAALALLHILSPSWREKVRVTVRRVLGPRQAVASAGTGGESSGAFWTKYKVVREVGTGGMGVVYEAQDTSLDRRVAIKKMRDEIRLDRRERERFLAEARTVASLKHPNIVEIYSIVEDGGEVYLVFEFAEGRTLYEVLSTSGPVTFAQARRLLKDACEAVDCAHKHKVVHRDIKPSNIMVTAEGRAKVMDFGVARQAKEAATKVMTNTVVGTPPYMAPESEQGAVGPQSDVYGLAVVFYELLTGKLPFAGVGAGMLLNKMNGRYTPISQAVSGLPPGIDEVMSRGLAADPAKRFRTAAEFSAAVESLMPA